jgi:type VI secretion system lysozyme-like protein
LLEVLTRSSPVDPDGTALLSNVERLKRSVRHEIQRLFQTRASRPAHPAELEAPSVLSYGVRPVDPVRTTSPVDRERLAAEIAQQLRRFEPRLRAVAVQIVPVAARPGVCHAAIEATIGDRHRDEVVSLTLPLPSHPGAAG